MNISNRKRSQNLDDYLREELGSLSSLGQHNFNLISYSL